MLYSFKSFGHPNITGTHKNTLEFTKDKSIGKIADCIIGVNSDFDPKKLKDFIQYCKNNNKHNIRLAIKAGNQIEFVYFTLNIYFDDEKEIVVRLSKFLSKRTLGIEASKASFHLSRELIAKLRNPGQEITVSISDI